MAKRGQKIDEQEYNSGEEISIPESDYKGVYPGDAAFVYKAKYTDHWYKAYELAGGRWKVETWLGGCGCE